MQERSSSSSSSSSRWCCGAASAAREEDHESDMAAAQSQKWSYFSNKPHLKETLHKASSDSDKRRLTADMQKLVWAQQRQEPAAPPPPPPGTTDAASDPDQNDEMVKAVDTIQAKEEEIEKRKAEVHQRVQAKLSKVELEARSLDNLRRELENLEDPTRKEVGEIRKKIEAVDRELKPLKQQFDKKEFKDASKALDDKVKLKASLVSKLMEVVTESEAVRMKKLNELSKSFDDMDTAALVASGGA
ncbi:actin cytoskeleton-regulatory complex protein pan-1-like isoform X2 [Selaginella moellendorffii]|uniref:actin cytoskeleton-regulatory complex protein pan-1-like isoform X2 n=1 Tax=Selaginella moellendorffii TaxID=88036 RepID=UPI000D1CD07D|nr:actin cytoskeleton-regulatory complex protein pan-1-like isoform X2 [Selaginella moellendorffii]|eukprot:XP_024537091.1 actin cytoskeleton-regulatory complex protein pan-1-like isoform X2 [Selaginella moellendorffii]